MLKNRLSPTSEAISPQKQQQHLQSPRKLSSPEKRFPVKPSVSPEKRPIINERTVDVDDPSVKHNAGLQKAMQLLYDTDENSEKEDNGADDTFTSIAAGRGDEGPNMDDTMVSTFSAFSAVPDMTMFAKLGHSPTKYTGMGLTPRRPYLQTPATARRPYENRSPSPTPRGNLRGIDRDDGNTTNLILDFTDQISGFSGYNHQSPARQARQSLYKNAPANPPYPQATPSINRNTISNLLDFDIPPAPTPRSMPTITPRELESLKSNFLSEISSLKASLSGKEAEVNSLKTAVGDAEKRVGESLEQVREETGLREQLAAEKEEWEKRGREMESILRNAKEEIVNGERERDDLEGRLEESERRREAAEMMAQEAESKMAGMKAGKPPATEEGDNTPGKCTCGNTTSGAVELAVEKVSRELHTLYKEKHETKVGALKKSYERRWDKKIKELEGTIEQLGKENEELRLGRDTTMTKVEPKDPQEVTLELEKQAAKDARTKELEAELEGHSQMVVSLKRDNTELRRLLEEERVERGKLVLTVDEMMALLPDYDDTVHDLNAAPPNEASQSSSHPPSTRITNLENLRGSISRTSGLRAPGSISGIAATSESRIGRGSSHERSGSQQNVRPGSGLGTRSGILSSIERMGAGYKGRGD